MSILQDLRGRNAPHGELVDRFVEGLRAARGNGAQGFATLRQIAALRPQDAPVVADILVTLVEAGQVERRVVVRVPHLGVEQVYQSLVEIPDTVETSEGPLTVTDEHVDFEFRATDSLAA